MPVVVAAVPLQPNWYFDGVLQAMEARLAVDDVRLETRVQAPARSASGAVADWFVDALDRPECVGAVAVGFEFTPDDVRRLTARGHPIVTVGGECPGLSAVVIDDYAAARAATEHLLALGHRSIAHVAAYALSPDFKAVADRARGYSDAMAAAGLGELSRVAPSDVDEVAASRVARRLLSDEDRPTAVFAFCDVLAYGVLHAAAALGLHVPRDLCVIGVDDHDDAAHRGLTTYRQDLTAVGGAAVDLLVAGAPPRTVTIPGELVVRNSTATPRPAPRRGMIVRLRRRP